LEIGIYSTWEDNRTKLLGEDLMATNHLKFDVVFDGYENDTIAFPHDSKQNYIRNIDNLVVKSAAKSLRKDAPSLSWIYLEYTDDMGHKFGDSPEMTKAVELADKQIGELYSAIMKRKNEDWLIIITTDHGRNAETGKNHGGQTDRERITWIVTNQKEINDRFQNGLAIVDIFPTVLQFLNIPLTDELKANLDGVSFLK